MIQYQREPLQRLIGEDCQQKENRAHLQILCEKGRLYGQAKGLAPNPLGTGIYWWTECTFVFVEGKRSQLDDEGKLKREFEKYSLRTLMSRCSNFANEKSAMEHLFNNLSQKAEPTLSMLTFSKYHCKVAGEGIEFVWGVMKWRFWSIPLKEKNTKQKFNRSVR